MVQKCTEIDRYKWDFSIQIFNKGTSKDRQKRFVYYDIDKI